MSYILMWLEAPLQSWGANSKYGRRSTMPFPTKSGIMGLLLSAMGKRGEQRELLAEFSNLDLQIECYPRRSDRYSCELEDFHMVGSGYDEIDPWETLFVPKKSDGTKPVGGGTKLTYRYYLQDMAFAAFIEVPEHLEDEICNALKNPVWTPYLGRKCCVPTEMIFKGTYSNPQECSKVSHELAELKNRICRTIILTGVHAEYDSSETITINDVPVQFGEIKLYKDRIVTVISENSDAENFS